MRPIRRGRCPSVRGHTVRFTDHRQARDYLVHRIGDYCSYCEMPKPDGPDVEHVRPQVHNPQYALRWGNFLLACRYCNSIKGRTPIVLNRYYWPDRHNTFLALTYSRSGPVPSTQLSPSQRARASALIELTGLDRRPGHPQCSLRDTRWRKREEAWSIASHSLTRLHQNNTPHMREQILVSARGHGFWSVWMTVFQDEPEVLRLLIQEFPGTALDCFDAQGHPLERQNGSL